MEEAKRKLNIMVIEDDDMTRKILVMEFKKRGHNVLEYADAASAMDDLKKEKKPVQAAVVDLMNMGYGGNIGDYMRKMKEYRATKIIYYTALTRQQFNTKILEDPNTDYVHKRPGSFQLIAEKIEGAF